ncbi:putative p-hydroxybenzoate hydroxylase [Nostocoides australiense Ben110]|uniref:Putative p-hydroxybenzoate hydroxylase n=1 Tax=Nostocoides australiense Ben110 TaxID=1193182 RepID=W6JY22_9MICO|nr:4-hydroxybenzoate 3-monooxygenase [Tetrasphaera australiensis]CCH74022.1 putative p-hydroxybenzoate hydroxylase [Tetrasphaera australiensis Ben110]
MTSAPIDTTTTAPVAIVGAGPAGLMLAHRLGRVGIECVNIDIRTREEIETTHRAGIIEAVAAQDLVDTGVSDRILRDGHEHPGVDLRFGGQSHRIDFQEHVGASVWLYPQTDVFIDLADARARDGGTVHFGVTDTEVGDVITEQPYMRFTAADGARHEVRAQFLVGADGSRSVCRDLVPEGERTQYFREYPFAWFGFMTQAPQSAPELVYTHSPHGFALLSQRTDTVQRMYFQCDPEESVDAWSDERIWEKMQQIVAGPDGFTCQEGPVLEKTVLRFRSFVQQPMRYGTLLLAGDAAHTVPPTGARGLNLALHDVKVLAGVLQRAVGSEGESALADYEPGALERVWRAQNFSYWMTQMLHAAPGASDFDLRRQMGELDNVVATRAGRTYLAEQYTGWPSDER